MRTHKALPAALVLAIFLSCTGLAQTVQSTLKLQVISGVPVVDGVFLNGQGPYRFLLDTGGQTNQMDSSLARKLGLAGSFERSVDTPAGSSEVPGTTLEKISLGPVEAVNQEFLISSTAAFHAVSPDIRGILGEEFLAKFDYTLDFKHHRVTFGDVPPSGAQVKFRRVDDCMAVLTDQGELMIDSGADMLMLFRESPTAATSVSRTSNAIMPVAMLRAPALYIGGKPYHPGNMVLHPMADAPVAGLLPATLFHAIFVSNSGGYVVFDPNEQ